MSTAQPSRTGRKPSVAVSPEAMRKALDELASLPTIEVETFKVLFRVGSSTAYRAAREGRFGCVKLGSQFRFPAAEVRSALGLPQPVLAPIPATDPHSEGDAP